MKFEDADHNRIREQEIRVVLIYYSVFSSFIKNDYDILSKYFNVIKFNCKQKRDAIKMIMAIWRSDVSFSWFAGEHSFLAVLISKILRKKAVVVAGGYDVACVPEINYGQFTLGWHKRMLTKFALKYADKVLVVDPSLKDDAMKNAKISGENIVYLPTGYDSNYWHGGNSKKDNVVLTTGGIGESVIKRKGFDTFVKAAKYLPDVKFVLVGSRIDNSADRLRSIATSNVEFTGFISNEELLLRYQKAKVYCQLSRYEGLPNALCESMLCECVPVGTKYCGIPTAIGNTGFYVEYGDSGATAEAIGMALASDAELGRNARERIKCLFPIKRREFGLVQTINELCKTII